MVRLPLRLAPLLVSLPVAVIALKAIDSGDCGETAAAPPAGLNLYLEAACPKSRQPVHLTLHRVELSADGVHYRTAFEDRDGRTLDLRGLSKCAQLLAAIHLPGAAYRNVRITVADSPGPRARTHRRTVVIPAPIPVQSGQTTRVLLRVDLPRFAAAANRSPAGRSHRGRLQGRVTQLEGPGGAFLLAGQGGRLIRVLTRDARVVSVDRSEGPVALAAGQTVLVDGAFDTAGDTLNALTVCRLGLPAQRRRLQLSSFTATPE